VSNYTKTVNFATKDNLSPGNPLKIVKGTEIDTEYNNIATAVATKTDNASAAITGGTITGITDLAVADGGTGASTAADARTNLGLGTIATQAASSVAITGGFVTGITDITVADGGTGASTAANARTNLGLVIGTDVLAPTGSAASLTSFPTFNQNTTGNAATVTTNANLTGAVTSVGNATSLGSFTSANLLAALTDETGTGSAVFATSPTLVTPALGTPSALVGTNITGTASGLTAGNVTTNANLTGAITSTGNATSLGSFSSANLLGALTDETGTGSAVFATSPTLVTPILGTPTSGTLTNATGLPLSTGVTGTLPVANGGTGTATPSIVAGTNVTVTGTWPNQTIAASGGGGGTPGGSTTQVQYNNAGAFGGITGATTNGTALTLVAPVLGTPASATLTNATGLPISTGVSGLGTGIATALAVNTGSSGAPVINGGALGTPTSGTVTNLTGTASININGTVGATTPSTGAFTSVNTQNTFGYKNRIINGAMVFDQRNAGGTLSAMANNTELIDRYRFTGSASVASKLNFAQNLNGVTGPVGFPSYSGFQTATAYTVTGSDLGVVEQIIEGYNIRDLAWGTANAKPITISFWVYSSLTGTFGGCLKNAGYAMSYPFTYSIPTANTWTYVSINITAPTTATWNITNGQGIRVMIGLGAGSTTSGTANGTWQAADYYSATGAVSIFGTSSATFYFTGLQVESGSSATSFDVRPYGTEFQLCQRYFWVLSSSMGTALNSTGARFNVSHTWMRATPSVSATAALNVTDESASDFSQSSANIAISENSATGGRYQANNFTGMTTNRFANLLTNGGKIQFSSEL
jgi:hypothetical protein